MNFTIDRKPPTSEEILVEQQLIGDASRRIKTRDTLITFTLILLFSLMIGAAVYWSTGSIKYASIAFSVFPVIGAILGLAGVITVVGFRSNAMRVIELNNEHIALLPVSSENEDDIRELCRKYPQVKNYRERVDSMGRALVNGELAMFWEWDASTNAKHVKQKAYLDNLGSGGAAGSEGSPSPQAGAVA